MKEIDTSDWSIVRIDLGNGYTITDHTLQSKEYFIRLCAKHDWELLSFEKGTNPMCA